MSVSNVSNLFVVWEGKIAAPVIPDTVTENGAGAFSSTGSANLDFFSSVVRDTPPAKVVELFKAAYLENPHLALKVLFNLRDCIKNGKQEKRVSFDALHFLKSWKPKTFLKNLHGFLNHGCYKDALVLHSMGHHPLDADAELRLMAAMLMDDMTKLASAGGGAAPKVSLSLAGKWAPTENCSFDKLTGAAHKIAKFCGWDMRTYRKNLGALRKALDILERHESLGEWDKINFEHVPSVAMKKQKKALERHLPEKFRSYLTAVMAGKAKMNSKGVQPHELVRDYMRGGYDDPATNSQWEALMTRLRTAGLFKDAVAVCDVSGSMSGVPLEVSIALGLVVAEMTVEPFKGRVITVSAVPQWHTINGATLREKVSSLSRAAWEMNTDFVAVFKMLLAEAKVYRLSPEQMIKKIFVFTDMQFDAATNAGHYQIGYDAVKQMYADAGYTVPQIVFWNLRDTHSSFPVRKDTPGVALMSGFSSEMLKMFLDDETMTPYSMMLKAVKDYEVFVVDE
jgi:hypothetical protein